MFELRDLPGQDTLRALARRIPELDPSAVEVCLLTLRAAGDMVALFNTFLARYGLTQGRFTVMMVLFRDPEEGLTPSVLAEKAGVTRATMTGLLDGLEREGLVQRKHLASDRRSSGVRLTGKGRKFLETILPGHYRRVAALMEPLSEPERKRLVGLMSKMRKGISRVSEMQKKGTETES